MKIRKAIIKDRNKLVKLINEYDKYEHSLNKEVNFDKIKDLKIKTSKTLKSKDSGFFVYEDSGKIIGFIEYRLDSKMKKGIIQNMFINKNYRNMKLGTKLVDYLINYFKNQKMKHVGSFVRIANKKALNFWKEQGFDYDVGCFIRREL